MTTLPECLSRKATEGIIERETANRLRREYKKAMRRANDAAEAGDMILAKEQKRIAARKKSRAATLVKIEEAKARMSEADQRSDGTAKGQKRWSRRAMRSFFGFDKTGRFTGPSVETERAILRRRAHRRLSDFLPEVTPNAVGQVGNRTLMDNVLREKLGRDTGDKAAKQYAEALKQSFEYLRREANRAGMSIPFQENYFPQKWSKEKLERAVARQGEAKAKQDFVDEVMPRLDRDQTLDAETGLPMEDDQLREVLGNVFDTIRTRGFSKFDKNKGHFSAKDLAANRANERFLVFRSPEDWLEAQSRYGRADDPNGMYDMMMEHLDDMASDVATARILGPQPDATVRQIRNELKARGVDQPTVAHLDALYNVTSRRANIPANETAAQWGHTLRNLLNAGALGGAFLPALIDTSFSMLAQAFVTGNRVGAPVRTMSTLARNFFKPGNTADQRSALRTIGVADHMLNRTQELNRLMIDELGPMGRIPRAAQWINQQVMRLSLLNRWTAMGRQSFELELLNEVTRQSRRQWSELTEAMRRSFERSGIDEGDWDAIRAEEGRIRDGRFSLLHPEEIAKSAPEAAEKLDRMLWRESRFAVPQAGVVERAGIVGGTRPGETTGEIMRTVGMLKGFPISQAVNQFSRIFGQIESGTGKLAYSAALLGMSTTAGALVLQLEAILGGKDPRPVNRTYLQDAMIRAGALGLAGDFAFGGVSKYGLMDTLVGPAGSAASAGLTLGTSTFTLASRLAQGDDLEEAARESDAGRELLDFVDEINPLGSLWFTELAFERAVHDQLKKFLDPEAENSFRSYREFVEERQGTEFFFPPGNLTPERTPEVGG